VDHVIWAEALEQNRTLMRVRLIGDVRLVVEGRPEDLVAGEASVKLAEGN
jgi:hypothetical protein